MAEFWLQMMVQTPIIIVLWLVVARDAGAVRRRIGTAPNAISPLAWGALAGLTWVGVAPYLIARGKTLRGQASTPVDRERNPSRLWPWLGLAAAALTVANAVGRDWNNVAQHAIFTVVLIGTAALARSRDRSVTLSPAPR